MRLTGFSNVFLNDYIVKVYKVYSQYFYLLKKNCKYIIAYPIVQT